MSHQKTTNFKQQALQVLTIEAQAVADLAAKIDDRFDTACELILACEGRVVVTGMGKSGHIGGKIAATLASTGTPAFFVHPGEASHGDLGMITAKDLVIGISNSGETNEILKLIPLLKRLGIPLITMSGDPDSSLGKAANVVIDVGVREEACPMNLAPTASTTATLAMGDALAVALLDNRGFTKEDFALSHPGGSLGKQLLLTIADLMHSGDDMPVVESKEKLSAGLMQMTSKGLGMTAVTDSNGILLGILTDGDLRRAVDRHGDIRDIAIAEIMSRKCKTVRPEMLAVEAVLILEDNRINGLIVVDADNRAIGALNVHDLLRAGIM
ncbi:MAG: KpsF/GutQ family sugar-phosphate isomerase [Chromatiales bacterium]|jgi:arabinose-5-phosphate isomerase|nr:KpsF/GutQ family sugar-phosphate isomerase [Chromatiales bacterium]